MSSDQKSLNRQNAKSAKGRVRIQATLSHVGNET
jgi:hypothetical protein